MYVAKIENKRGNILTLTQNETAYQIVRIDGLNPPNAQINTLTMASIDGARFNSSKLLTREIVLTIQLNGGGTIVEENRQKLYRYFPTKEWCKFYYKNNHRDVFIEAYVESVEVSPFDNAQQMQVAILCCEPYFKGIEMIVDDISKRIPCFEFPFAFGSNGATNPGVISDLSTDDAIPFSEIQVDRVTHVYNDSESECGMIIDTYILHPITKLNIQNTETGEFLELDYEFLEGDEVIINTNLGQKSITLIRNGISSNLFIALVKGSTFFQLALGDNFFGFTLNEGADDGYVSILFKHYTVYRGV